MQPASAQPGIVFQKTWGGLRTEHGNSIALDVSGNIYMTGSSNSFGPATYPNSSLTLLKYSPTGNLLWAKMWSGIGNGTEAGGGVVVDQSGNIYVGGSTSSFGAGRSNVLLLKFDPSGNLLWQRIWGAGVADGASSLALDGSGNIYLAGSTDTTFRSRYVDVLVMKVDSAGNLLWQKNWGGPNNEYAYSIAVDSSSNIYVTGYTTSFGPGGSNVFLLKLDSSGNLLWQRVWGGGSGSQSGQGVAVDASGNIYVTGYTSSFGAGNIDVLLMRFDMSGNLLWQKTWGGWAVDEGSAVTVDASGNAYVTGVTYSFGASSGDSEVFLLKVDPSGNLVWQKTWGGPDADNGNGIALDPSGNVLIAGDASLGPYSLGSSGNKTLGTPSFLLGSPAFTLVTPNFTARTPGGIVQNVSGSQSWAGSVDELLLEYAQPATVSFQTSPVGGSLSFNGTTYSNGQSGSFNYATVPISAHPPPGYFVTGWSSTGAIAVTNPNTNATTATISGSGTLTANFAPCSIPAAPQGLSATGGPNKVVLAWSGPSSPGGPTITGYKVYRGTSPGTETLLTTLGNVNAYNDTSVNPSTVYYYKLTALNSMGESPSSNEANATPTIPPNPSPPSSLPLFFYLPVLAILVALALMVVIILKRRHSQSTNPTLAA